MTSGQETEQVYSYNPGDIPLINQQKTDLRLPANVVLGTCDVGTTSLRVILHCRSVLNDALASCRPTQSHTHNKNNNTQDNIYSAVIMTTRSL